ncbi:reverse transcriptase family protein [Citrobacter amalonaticus]|uniref:RNA-directed DNA polymerase n=1 Tax=Citrobacter amalonaticus TaxID=35703 RepID=A0AAW9LX43_CITAM|nr:reverse transcriptase family protein [Citrobacter amalonaticus]ELR9582409.1 RNA-directed DNA polymerase [Citrobacter amalonaticus]MDV2136003.1 reverse transcriptase family protein [Citrobacter amalonaticus]MEB0583509.1 reverse transcriptase family protein [Citrobacter amalonaticus]SAZ71893.1 RNA-directed DNA polymerase (Reverse transcriptase) [Citrobacter amalonaticus]SAZ77648.1 RNA-directed DNA polymerase (Reverse transcriptase) [Citrobacter amalonaticus]
MKTPLPLFFTFADAEQLLKALSKPLRDRYSAELLRLQQLGLPPLVSWSILSVAIGVSPQFITSILKNKSKYYRVFPISKGKGKKKRIIEAPKVSLKIIQSWFAYHISLNGNITLSKSAFAFIPGKNGIYEAASVHCGAKWIMSIDLRDFFHTITSEAVVLALTEIGYREDQASKLSDLLTLNQRLPQGAPSSPVISNLVFSKTDFKINELIADLNVKYTRYADDLTFSSEDESFDINSLKERIVQILVSDNWIVADEKLKIAKAPNRLKVHGFLVHEIKPRLTKGYRNKIRAYKHLLNTGKVVLEDLDKIKGHINYSDYIDRLNE